MARQVQMERNGVPARDGAERSATEATEGVTRGRPGRRSTEERTLAVVEEVVPILVEIAQAPVVH